MHLDVKQYFHLPSGGGGSAKGLADRIAASNFTKEPAVQAAIASR